jgi:hypothetical protein
MKDEINQALEKFPDSKAKEVRDKLPEFTYDSYEFEQTVCPSD